ncbi:hypothetical protein E8E13_011441 [Curvularia kusanoi]|uniref:Azaphilone pigments biosynthesis cluster protein L N-terminal domain-containing protein n=1 Tax=Curvularia kusanoi TaxID=90978 RepID=A0A9P4TPU5_CURKU|nr:hypothetical protein E8E13_011441 [Curvularia kusanoi]
MKKWLLSYKTTLVVAFYSLNVQDHSISQESLSDLNDLISGAQEDLEDQLDAVNRAGEGSRTIFGTDTSRPEFNLTVARNEVGVGAVSSSGVHSAQTLQGLLHSRTPELALALQALQTQLTNIRSEAVQAVLNDIPAEQNPEGPQPPLIVF